MLRSLCLLVAFSAAALAQPFPVKIHPVQGGVSMLEGYGGNVGVFVSQDGVMMIDAQFESMSRKLQAKIAELSDKPVRFLINTHWHFDHTEGNKLFGEQGTTIVAHKNVKARMAKGQLITGLGREVPASPEISIPGLVYDGALTFRLGGEEVRLLHFPNAHTDGDTVVHFVQADVIHMGDIFFHGLYPFVDSSSGGRVDGLIAAVEAVLKLVGKDTKIIPGHGPLTDAAGLKAYHEFLVATRNKLAPMLEAGLSIEEIIAKRPTQDTDEAMGKAFLNPEQFLRTFVGAMTPPKAR